MNKRDRDREWNRFLVMFFPSGNAVAGRSPGDYCKPTRIGNGAMMVGVAAKTQSEAIDAASRKLKEDDHAA